MLFHPIRFCLNYLGLTLLMIALSIGALVFFDFEIGNASTTLILIMLAAMLEGQVFVERSKGRPESSAMWRAALPMTWLVILLSAVMLCFHLVLFPSMIDDFGLLSPGVWAILIAAVTLVTYLALRLGYGVGVRATLKKLPGPGV